MGSERPEVVIVGGGFGGLYAARALRGARVHVTIVDRRNHHLFQPLLYQVATAALNPADIAAPIRSVFRGARNVSVLLAEATGARLNPEGWDLVFSADGEKIDYHEHLWPRFVWIAIAVFFGDLLLRRVRIFDRKFTPGRRAKKTFYTA